MNIVAIRQGAIGDSLLSFSVLSALRARYTEPHLTYVGHPAVLPLAKAWGIAEDVYNYEDRQWDEVFSAAGVHSANLLALFQQTDLAIAWVQNPVGLVQPNLLKAGAKEAIIGPWHGSEKDPKHMVEYLAEPLGLSPLGTGFTVSAPGKNNDFCAYNAPIAIHPGCSSLDRRWPATSFATVINQLLSLHHPVLLLIGSTESDILQAIRKRIPRTPQAKLLTVLQNASLLEVAKHLKQCRYYLGNDSGIGHLAGMLGIPTLILFGPSNPSCMPPHVMHPLGPHVEVIQEQSLARLSADEVLQRILRRIS